MRSIAGVHKILITAHIALRFVAMTNIGQPPVMPRFAFKFVLNTVIDAIAKIFAMVASLIADCLIELVATAIFAFWKHAPASLGAVGELIVDAGYCAIFTRVALAGIRIRVAPVWTGG